MPMHNWDKIKMFAGKPYRPFNYKHDKYVCALCEKAHFRDSRIGREHRGAALRGSTNPALQRKIQKVR